MATISTVIPLLMMPPRFINIHSLTPDGRQAFVSYPHHPNHRTPQLVSVSWFDSVILHRLDGYVTLMAVIETLLTGWSIVGSGRRPAQRVRPEYITIHHHQRVEA